MITCDVLGKCDNNNGLGNQMFCIATTLALAYKNETTAVFPDLRTEHYEYYGRTIFHLLDKKGNKNFVKYEFKEPPYTSTFYHELPFAESMKLTGYFQSYKYFDCCRDLILSKFSIPEDMDRKIMSKYGNIIDENTVSLHIRRGDYLQFSNHYQKLGLDYYQEALKLVANDNSKILIFSDDIEWCKHNLDFIENNSVIFVENQTDVEDLWLISKIKNNIIANSTFSWWAAYLNNNNDKKIVCPKKWFGPARSKDNELETKDLFPKEWIKI